MPSRRADIAFAVFCSVLVASLLFVYFASPLRERLETKLYDLRTRLAPDVTPMHDVAVVGIGETLLHGRQAFGYADLNRLVRACLAASPRTLSVLLYPDAFSYDDPGLSELAGLAATDPRLYLGTFGLNANASSYPQPLARIINKVRDADTRNYYRRDVLRRLPVAITGKNGWRASLIGALANQVAGEGTGVASIRTGIDRPGRYFWLYYFRPDAVPAIDAATLLAGGRALTQASLSLAGRDVLIGFTAYRPWRVQPSFVNSPWQRDGDDLHLGLPLVNVMAMGLENLREGSWLRPGAMWINALQTILVAAFSFLVWRASIRRAVFLLGLCWVLLLVGHALLFSAASIFIPLGDTLMASSLAMIAGALWRLRYEGKLRAAEEARAASQRAVAQVQDRFLKRFSFELSTLNQRVYTLLQGHGSALATGSAASRAYVRARGSCEELQDYLSGIQQFLALDGGKAGMVTKRPIALEPIIRKVIARFDFRQQEGDVSVVIEPGEDAWALADATLLEQVVFNLVSNAIKYSPKGGVVSISVNGDAKHVALTVKDQGPGIAAEFHERIFEKFYRVKDDITVRVKGHGLGLYLSQYFATLMNGHVSVVSTVGQGAQFTLRLGRASVP